MRGRRRRLGPICRRSAPLRPSHHKQRARRADSIATSDQVETDVPCSTRPHPISVLRLACRTSSLEYASPVPHAGSWLGYVALFSAAVAAVILLHYLVKKPKLDLQNEADAAARAGRVSYGLRCGFHGRGHGADDEAGVLRLLPRDGPPFQDATNPSIPSRSQRRSHPAIPFSARRAATSATPTHGMLRLPDDRAPGGLRHVYLLLPRSGYRGDDEGRIPARHSPRQALRQFELPAVPHDHGARLALDAGQSWPCSRSCWKIA